MFRSHERDELKVFLHRVINPFGKISIPSKIAMNFKLAKNWKSPFATALFKLKLLVGSQFEENSTSHRKA
jgi:hypothetical protein